MPVLRLALSAALAGQQGMMLQVHGTRGDEQRGVPQLRHLGCWSHDLPATQWADAL